jgi:hypothetical protein
MRYFHFLARQSASIPVVAFETELGIETKENGREEERHAGRSNRSRVVRLSASGGDPY